jgi:hypothetical protein
MKLGGWLKEGNLIKMDRLRFREAFLERLAEEVLQWNIYENWIKTPK